MDKQSSNSGKTDSKSKCTGYASQGHAMAKKGMFERKAVIVCTIMTACCVVAVFGTIFVIESAYLKNMVAKLEQKVQDMETLMEESAVKERNKRETTADLKSAHLVLHDPTTTEYQLRWTANDHGNRGHNSGAVTMFDYDDQPMVMMPGAYLIYVQLTIAGKRHTRYTYGNPACTFQVGVQHQGSNNVFEVLMYSSATQLRMGRRLFVDQTKSRDVHAEDSAYVSGVFLLSSGDKLSVRLENYSKQNCILAKGSDRAFFGLVKL